MDEKVLDVDGDGSVTALGDGLMVIRKLFGAAFAGDALTDKAISTDATRTTDEIHNYIDEMTLLIEKNLDTNLDSSDLSESSFDQGELKNELANQLGVDSELIEFSATAG